MQEDSLVGGIFGVVIGDALGLPVQFEARDKLSGHPITDMRGGGVFGLPAGAWSDDSSLTLCLVESLCEVGYNPEDIAARFIRWYRQGYWTPFGESFDIGRTTANAIDLLIDGADPLEAGLTDEHSNGNGSLMRILPAIIYFAGASDEELLEKVCEISRITHGHPRAQLGCCLYALVIKELLSGKSPSEAYQGMQFKAAGIFAGTPLAEELSYYERVISGALPRLPEREIKSSGYVVHTLEAALWSFLTNHSFRETLIAAVNLGEDTDTVGAVSGGLAGVYYGINSIPANWLNALIRYADIQALVQRFALAVKQS
ncbi:MAG TPA: ADP-ribosylglycohydrolase family protein [Desulfobacteria bacterium]|nr:ADP-ribosylglycohydrolase family protein [Desulfobacteria bacterium]